jgi:alpha,alpha-trehalase
MSHGQKTVTGPRHFIVDVDETVRVLLEQEDTNRDSKISITDHGPKVLAIGTVPSNGIKTFEIRVRRKSAFRASSHSYVSSGNIHAHRLAPRASSCS